MLSSNLSRTKYLHHLSQQNRINLHSKKWPLASSRSCLEDRLSSFRLWTWSFSSIVGIRSLIAPFQAPPLPACSVNSCVFRCSRAPRPIMMYLANHNTMPCGQATSASERLLPTKCDEKKHFPRKNTCKFFQPVRFHSNLCRNLAQT